MFKTLRHFNKVIEHRDYVAGIGLATQGQQESTGMMEYILFQSTEQETRMLLLTKKHISWNL